MRIMVMILEGKKKKYIQVNSFLWLLGRHFVSYLYLVLNCKASIYLLRRTNEIFEEWILFWCGKSPVTVDIYMCNVF